MAPDTWRCECGYTNLGAKLCMVCRRPRTAVSSSEENEEPRGFAPPPPPEEPRKRRSAR